jgi:hypothetical protein
LFGALTVLLVGWAGFTGWNAKTGLLAAWFTAVAFILVRESHYATNDALVTFLSTFAVLTGLKIQESGSLKWYVLAGVTLGLGFAAKYTAIFTVLPLIVAHFLSPGVDLKTPSSWQIRRWLLLVMIAVLSASLASPYFIITPGNVIRDVYQYLYLPGREGFEGRLIDEDGGYLYYLKTLNWGLGYALLILCLGGLFYAIWQRNRNPAALITAILPLSLFLFMGRQQMYFARFLLPAIPPLLILAAAMMVSMIRNHVGRYESISIWIILTLAVIITIQPLVNSLRSNNLLHQEDTRTLAKKWIESNVPAGSKFAIEWTAYSPQLAEINEQSSPLSPSYEVTSLEFEGIYAYNPSWFIEEQFDYIIATSFIYNVPWLDVEKNQLAKERYLALDQEFDLVYEISPFKDQNKPDWIYDEIYGPVMALGRRYTTGPVLKIYRVTN